LNPGDHVLPRTARSCSGGYSYHVLNRGNARATVFHKPDDYDAFLDLMAESSDRTPMRILAYCLMRNHFHLALWPREDGDVSRWMHWLLTTHVRRHLGRYRSSGHFWQGRFKAFPIQEDGRLLAVLRYFERNPPRAGLAEPKNGRGRACAGSQLRRVHRSGWSQAQSPAGRSGWKESMPSHPTSTCGSYANPCAETGRWERWNGRSRRRRL
jgi:REP element-mobilizing transposase RayT